MHAECTQITRGIHAFTGILRVILSLNTRKKHVNIDAKKSAICVYFTYNSYGFICRFTYKKNM